MRVAILALGLLVGTACDLGLTSGCDFRDATLASPEPRCQERSGLSSAAFTAACKGLQGKTVKGGCDTETSVGGCDVGAQGDGTRVVDWYYSPKTAADVQAECDGDGGKVVQP